MTDSVPFHELALAAYCPRKLYYARQDDRTVPDEVERVRDLAFRYDELLDGADLPAERLAAEPATWRDRLTAARERLGDDWAALVAPAERDVLLSGRDCRGYAEKVLALDPPAPSLVSPGRPPENGVWEPQSVRAVAAAKALAWREGESIERAFVEYPAHGVVREVSLSVRRRAAYRRALRTVRSLDGPPPRLSNDAKCDACEYRAECGVRTRSLRSLLFGD